MAEKKRFDPNQFGGFVPGNVTRGGQAGRLLNPAERRAAERAKQAPVEEVPETPVQTETVIEKPGKGEK